MEPQLTRCLAEELSGEVNVLPAELAAAIVFLASSRAGKGTGRVLTVDGGVALSYPR